MKKNRIKVLDDLARARSAMVIAAISIRQNTGADCHVHADQLDGAADMVQNWIENIRKELS